MSRALTIDRTPASIQLRGRRDRRVDPPGEGSPAERATMKAPGWSVVVGSLDPDRKSFPIFGRRRRHRDRPALSTT